MSILINGMDLPNGNDLLTIAIDRNGEVFSVFLDENRCELCIHRPDKKPIKAVPVPPHGDLIDRAEAVNEFCEIAAMVEEKSGYEAGAPYAFMGLFLENEDEFPTIIQAEEAEG